MCSSLLLSTHSSNLVIPPQLLLLFPFNHFLLFPLNHLLFLAAVTLSDVFQSANMGHPTAITAYGSVKKSQPKRRLPKGGKLEALHQTPAPSSSSSASSQDKNKDKNKNHNNDGNKSINMGNSSTISNTNTNTKTHTNTNVKTTQNTGNVVAAAVVVVPEVVEIVHEEEFPGHPDIAPGVTVDRNQSIRRRTLELTSGTGNDSTNGGISAMTNANNESLRAALDMLLDPDNDLPLDEVTSLALSCHVLTPLDLSWLVLI